jgi:FlaA1/EpsC-like NDP-sugar epimerase
MNRILITGGSGFLGQYLANSLKLDHEVVLASRNQKQLLSAAHRCGVESIPLDVSSFNSTFEVVQRIAPDFIVHAAATKFVGLGELYPNECIDINITGSQNVARAAIQCGVDFVLGISTDKATSPIANIYGMTKAVMERLYSSLDGTSRTRFACVRYGNVAWSTGSVFPLWAKMAEENRHIITTGPEMSRFFFPIEDAVNLVLTALKNHEKIQGHVLSLPMKGTLVKNILSVWAELEGIAWSVGEKRTGDRHLEYLISENEILSASPINLDSKSYFILDPSGREVNRPLTAPFSSLSAEQLTADEIKQLIMNKPNKEML